MMNGGSVRLQRKSRHYLQNSATDYQAYDTLEPLVVLVAEH